AWIEDESNAHTAFDRNYLRHDVMPVIAGRWPDYRQRLLRSAIQCASADELLQERAREDLVNLDRRRERLGESIAQEGFASLSLARQQNVLRHWADDMGLAPMPHRVPGSV